ncbi:MAG TPA: ABC transporter ATP-binding protein [Candidatus Dormibacteraeota bacterium]|nr:ABC transporter ATP-binding protein [Candidatus Dormibacteraeota bacterium]
MTEAGAILEIDRLTKRFGGIVAVDGCSFRVHGGSITGLIGPNGSGKTTVLNMLSGYLARDAGVILFDGRPIPRPDPTVMYRRGMSRTFQRARVLPELDVLDNLLVAAPKRGFAVWGMSKANRATVDYAMHLLEEFRLIRLAEMKAGELSYGQQKLLEFAAVLMGQPRLVLLDEPTAGVNHVMVDLMTERIREFHATGMTFLVIEHNMEFVMGLCDPLVVLDHGKTLFAGAPAEVQSNQLVLDAYLGD